MRRLALVMAVALASGRADALGLGDIELHSALNEPLNAEVRLITDKPGEAAKASVVLAPNSEFERAGIDRPAELSNLKFDIVTDKSGASMVKITSTKPIREPFLDFVVQLRWPAGKLLREYTVLLDPPVFGEEKQAAPVSAPTTTAPEAKPATAESAAPTAAMPAPAATAAVPVTPPHPTPAPRESKRHIAAPTPAAKPPAHAAEKKAVAGASSYGPTKRNDTLWNIANSLRPDDSVTVYQMMMALLKNNPQAFYNNNVNDLKAGYVLRVPDKAVVAAIDQQQAVRDSARQYQEWQQRRQGGVVSAPSSVSAKPSAAGAPAAGTAQEKESARLRLVAPGETSGTTAGGVKAQLDKLRGDLAMALESSDAAKRESDELRSRVASLEEQINSLQRLLTLKDQALSDMQQRSGLAVPPAAKPQQPAEAPAPAKPAESAPAKPAVANKPKPASKPAEPASPDLLANPSLLGAAAGALLLVVSLVWLMVRRRRGNSGQDEAVELPIVEEDTPPVNIEIAQDSSAEAASGVEEMDDAHREVAEEVAQQAEQDIPQTANDLDVLQSSEGEIDPIVEADVYLAYRRYQQAEALIQSALDKQPNRQDLQAKLLEIYYSAKNADAFHKVAQSLFINLGSNEEDPLWQRIVPMGRELCPDQDLFGSQDASSEESEGESVDVSSMTEQSEAPAEVAQESFEAEAPESGEAPQEEKMELDLNIGGEGPAESLGDALDLGGPEAQASEEPVAEETPVAVEEPAEVPSEEEQKANTNWEGESAAGDFGNIDFGLDDSDLLAGTDVVGTKLDLARAYIDMGDNESAREILKEVAEEGNAQQKQEANDLMEEIA